MSDKVEETKLTELQNWCTFKVHDEIKDRGQNRMSTRWVIREKLGDGPISIKTRLVARRLQENSDVRSDSPTANKESLHMLLAII